MSTKSVTIHLAYIIVICTLLGMLYIQHNYFSSHAFTESTKQSEAEQALLSMTTKFETLQLDFEALHQEKKPTEQSQFYQEQYRTLEVKHNALQTICEHHKVDLDKCLEQTQPPTSAGENSHPMYQLNKRLREQKQSLEVKKAIQGTTKYEYDDPAKYASPETTKPKPAKSKPQIEFESEPIKPELKPESDPASITPERQAESMPESITPEPQAESVPEPITPEPQPKPKPKPKPKPEPEPIQPEPQAESAPEPIQPKTQAESKPESLPETNLNTFQCPSTEAVNNGLITGNFKENNIVWWLDFSFRPINSNEEVKASYQALFSGKFMDCYYRVGPKASEKIIDGIWVVIKGAAKDYQFVPSKNWQDCGFDGCLKKCVQESGSACEFELEKK